MELGHGAHADGVPHQRARPAAGRHRPRGRAVHGADDVWELLPSELTTESDGQPGVVLAGQRICLATPPDPHQISRSKTCENAKGVLYVQKPEKLKLWPISPYQHMLGLLVDFDDFVCAVYANFPKQLLAVRVLAVLYRASGLILTSG